MLKFFKNHLSRFRKDADGNASMEAVILLPVIMWMFAAGFTFFEAYRAQAVAEKAAYTVSDMISRETLEITPTYITNMRKIYRDLSGLTNAETALRVTVLRWNQSKDRFYIDWSQRRGDIPRLRNRDVRDYDDLLPTMVHNERIILVETASDYDPGFSGVLAPRVIETFVYTRPRYAPQIVWNKNG